MSVSNGNLKKVKVELEEIRDGVPCDERRVMNEEEDFQKIGKGSK